MPFPSHDSSGATGHGLVPSACDLGCGAGQLILAPLLNPLVASDVSTLQPEVAPAGPTPRPGSPHPSPCAQSLGPDQSSAVTLEPLQPSSALLSPTPMPQDLIGPLQAIDYLITDITHDMTPAILPCPAAAKPRAVRRRRSLVSNPRRSGRLATKTTATLNAVARASSSSCRSWALARTRPTPCSATSSSSRGP